ncbi:IS3 family transposase [Aquipuribacter sp. SD81]|uniref:IS3 family transposase n=1 Tax=Aquipuribacter sp. SD81 TaxID=3127703 RepID=UPI00301A4B26
MVTTEAIRTLYAHKYGVYGARKAHADPRRTGHVVDRGDGPRPVARCTVERLMRAAGLRGITRARVAAQTIVPGQGPDGRHDLVQRAFAATAPDQL